MGNVRKPIFSRPSASRSREVLRLAILAAGAVAVVGFCSAAGASYRDLVGFAKLQRFADVYGLALPTGEGVPVAHVEAGADAYMPDSSDPEFYGKTFENRTQPALTATSWHSTSVGRNFYGGDTSIAPALGLDGDSPIRVWEAGDWMNDFLQYGNPSNPRTTTSRIANHSWIGSKSSDAQMLRRMDLVVDEDDFLQIVALPNVSNANKPLWKDAYNVISVGLGDGRHRQETTAVDATYTAGRVAPTLVTPGFSPDDGSVATSWATPMVSAAAALLLETGRAPALSNGTIRNNRDTRSIRHAETSEVVKAVLMAGADRYAVGPRPQSTKDDLTDYRVDTANNLDSRYGAGQLNVFNSFNILRGEGRGEQDSRQDDAGAGDIGVFGWDYDPAFGGTSGSNNEASYYFTAPDFSDTLVASLVWNLDVFGAEADSTAFYDLDLELLDVTGGRRREVDSSRSARENTENLFFDELVPGNRYELRVAPGQSQEAFLWDYGLAWRLDTAALAGDVNQDGEVDGNDLSILLGGFGLRGGALWSDGDLNGDGDVDDHDLNLLLTNFGAGRGSAPAALSATPGDAPLVPEPPAESLLLLGMLGLWLTGGRRKALPGWKFG